MQTIKIHVQPMNSLSFGFHCLVAPAVPTCEVPTSVMSGSVVELRCQEKEGNPAPEYTWFKDGTSLLGNQKLGKHNSSYTMNTKSGILVRPFQVLNTNRHCDEINGYLNLKLYRMTDQYHYVLSGERRWEQERG